MEEYVGLHYRSFTKRCQQKRIKNTFASHLNGECVVISESTTGLSTVILPMTIAIQCW